MVNTFILRFGGLVDNVGSLCGVLHQWARGAIGLPEREVEYQG